MDTVECYMKIKSGDGAIATADVRVGVGASAEVGALLALLILPLAAGTVSMTSVPLSTTSTAVNAIASLANSTWPRMSASDDRDDRFITSLARSLPPPSIDLEASSASSRSLECSYEFGRSSECSYKDSHTTQDSHSAGRRLEQDGRGKKLKKKKFLKKWALPLLIGYKLKFLVLVPLLFATLALLVASTGFAGFFFAMFTAAIALPKSGGYHGR